MSTCTDWPVPFRRAWSMRWSNASHELVLTSLHRGEIVAAATRGSGKPTGTLRSRRRGSHTPERTLVSDVVPRAWSTSHLDAGRGMFLARHVTTSFASVGRRPDGRVTV